MWTTIEAWWPQLRCRSPEASPACTEAANTGIKQSNAQGGDTEVRPISKPILLTSAARAA
jgi:hypothetical protein